MLQRQNFQSQTDSRFTPASNKKKEHLFSSQILLFRKESQKITTNPKRTISNYTKKPTDVTHI